MSGREREGASPRTVIDDTLRTIAMKLPMLLTPLQKGGSRLSVDCVAFGAVNIVDDQHRRKGCADAFCLHPNRGKQFGCLLTETKVGGVVRRIRNAECDFRIRRGTRGAVALGKRMQEEVLAEAWDFGEDGRAGPATREDDFF